MFVQLLSSLILFILPIAVYVFAQKKWSMLRNRIAFMTFVGLIFTLTIYIPLHEGGHVIFANISGIQVTEVVLFFVSDTGIKEPAVGVNLDNIDNPLFTSRYVFSWAGGILTASMIFLFLSILFYFKKQDALYFSVLPILRSFFEINDLNSISILIQYRIVPYFVLFGFLLLFIYFLKMSFALKKETRVSKRLAFSLSLAVGFVMFFLDNPFYYVALVISSLGVYLSQIEIVWVTQFFGWILIVLSAVFVFILSSRIRYACARKRHLSEDGFKKKIAFFYEKHLHKLVLARQILLFFFPTAVLMVLAMLFPIKLEYLLGSIVLGLSILIFVSTQLPLLMKARLLITFSINDGGWSETLTLRPGKTTKVESAIRNLGFTTYKNSTIKFYFGKDFDVIPYENALYPDLDFKKKFTIQRRHGGVMFDPKDNFLTVPPQEVFIFPMWVKVPDK